MNVPSKTTMEPNEKPLNREQMFVMLACALGLEVSGQLHDSRTLTI